MCCVSQYYSSVETVRYECVCSYCALGLLQLSGRHHGFELLTIQISEQCGLQSHFNH